MIHLITGFVTGVIVTLLIQFIKPIIEKIKSMFK